MTKSTWLIVAALLVAVVAIGGYFLVGPGSGDGYNTPGDSGYSQGGY